MNVIFTRKTLVERNVMYLGVVSYSQYSNRTTKKKKEEKGEKGEPLQWLPQSEEYRGTSDLIGILLYKAKKLTKYIQVLSNSHWTNHLHQACKITQKLNLAS